MKIKCVKCGQSFSTVTSLSKHKRFCDTTNQSLPLSGAAQLSCNPISNNNPFTMYRPPPGCHLPFFPSAFPPYPPMFHSTAPPPNFIPPMFLNQIPPKFRNIESHDHLSKRLMTSTPERTSPLKDRFTPPRLPSFSSKISPSTAEEASSNLTPSPARPPPGPNAVFNNPRDQISRKRDIEELPRDLSKPCEEERKRRSSTSSEEGEQPLDLSVTRNHLPRIPEEFSSLEIQLTPIRKSKEEEEKVEVVDIEDTRPTGDETPKGTNSTPQMAYPRPIHPMLLEMYRPNFHAVQGPQANERLLPPPFGPPRFPFINPLQHPPNFDLLRPGMQRFGGVKPFHDVMQHQAQNKMKDRYGCKFCGKVI